MRVKFEKGKQRQFIKEVLISINSPSLKDLSVRLNIPYSPIKKYFNELRLLPLSLFNDLCFISHVNKDSLKVIFFEDNWGQVKGGKKGKK
jgi:hypothetical protein